MSETPRSEQPEKDIKSIANEVIAMRHQNLPENIDGWFKKEEGELASPEEIFEYFDAAVKKAKKDKEVEKEWKQRTLEDNDTNNFHLFFKREYCADILNGKMGVYGGYGIEPFYINSRFDNAWNQMCEEFHDDVVIITEFEENGYGKRSMNPKEKESLKKLAMYLIGKDIPTYFLEQ